MNIPPLFLFVVVVLLLLQLHHLQAQPNGTGPPCSPDPSIYPCQTYVYYRAMPPDFLDLANIADLFSVSRLMISKPSNISSPNSPLLPDQSLLIPITCSCNSKYKISYSNYTYKINSGDTFYLVSTLKFQNLTSYQAVELVNPNLVATNLPVGVEAIFPVFCKCLNKTQVQNQANLLITYVLQPSDTFSSISAKFGTNPQLLRAINGDRVNISDTVYIPVSKIPNFSQPITTLNLPSPSSDKKGVIVGLSIGLGITGFLLIILILVMGIGFYRGFFRKSEEDKETNKYQYKKAKSFDEQNLMADVSGCLDKYRVYGIDDLREATAEFSESCLIQGSVYRGVIDGEMYAIKRMKWNACEELKILQKVNHGNLVRLEGFCIDSTDNNCYLIYEYIENGSLDSWLHGDKNDTIKILDWRTRLKIAIDVANGLHYIHEHTRPTVVHKDIKTSNILLDGNMRAKIANFGLAKSGCNAITMNIVGTQGYIAPEYLADGIVTTKMDVFAFGVVLLEIISGREAMDEDGRVLWTDANKVLEGREDEKFERLKKWMDSSLMRETCSLDSVMSVLVLAVSCLQREPSRRPNMVDAVYTLSKSDDLNLDFSQDGLSASPLAAR